MYNNLYYFYFRSLMPATFHCACAVQKCCSTRRICSLHLLDNDNTQCEECGWRGGLMCSDSDASRTKDAPLCCVI